MTNKDQSDYNDACAYLQSGIVLYGRGDRENAVACFRRAIEIMPDLSNAHFWLGNFFFDSENLNDAKICFEHALEINPSYFEACFYLGNVLFLLGNKEDAKACYEHAIELSPDFIDSYLNLNGVLTDIGVAEIEVASYKKMLDIIEAKGPQRIRIETSSVCNLRCQHCPTGTSYKNTERGIMGMALFEEILAQIRELKILFGCILYLGGEPLLNKDFTVMCQRIKDETEIVHTQFNTNAMLLNEEICRGLANTRVDRIGISVDGRSPEENDAIRLGSKYQTVVKNVEMLRNCFKEAQIVIDNTIIKRSGDPEEPVNPDFLVRDFPGLIISTNYAMKWPGLDIEKSSLKELSIERRQPYNFCNKPFREIAVRSNGDVTMCCYDILGENVMGNIHNSKLMDIWKGEQYKKLRRNMLDCEIGLLPDVCKKCIQYTGEIPIIVE